MAGHRGVLRTSVVPVHVRPPAWLIWLVLSGAVVIAYPFLPEDLQPRVFDLCPLAAAGVILLARRGRSATRKPWLILALGLALYGLGDLVYDAIEASGVAPFPSLADAFYLPAYVLILGGLGRFFLTRRQDAGDLLDGLLLLSAAAALLWTFVIGPLTSGGSDQPLTVAIALAYPIMDLALVALLIRAMLGGARDARLFILALGCFLASDLVYAVAAVDGTYVAGVIDLGWLTAFALWGTVALRPMAIGASRPVAPHELSARRMLVLGAAAMTPIAIAIAAPTRHAVVDPVAVALSSAVLFLILFARLALLVRRQHALLDERGRLQSALEQQAFEDPLTGLPNRRGFLARVDAAIAADPGHVAVLFLDLDDFKTVNDSLGHAAGDRLLRIVGERLRTVSRASEAVARLGGDEFAVLLEHIASPEAASSVAGRLLSTLAQPVSLDGRLTAARCSIGIALAGPEAADGATLMRNADLAVYRAKAAGKGRYDLFDQVLFGDVLRALAIRDGLSSALERGQFALFFQPIVAAGTGSLEAFEVLLRWQHPELGMVMPGEFIPVLEHSGHMQRVGTWVLETACREAAAWRDRGLPDVGVNVNISPVQLASPSFLGEVRAALDGAPLAARLLTLEITETGLDDAAGSMERLVALRSWGVRLSIDDFGTGYSSLSRVANLPITELKLDRSMLTEDRLLGAVLQLGHALGVRLVAEGVESGSQLARVRDLGCEAVQGYHIGRPLSPDDLGRFIESRVGARRTAPTPPAGPLTIPANAASG